VGVVGIGVLSMSRSFSEPVLIVRFKIPLLPKLGTLEPFEEGVRIGRGDVRGVGEERGKGELEPSGVVIESGDGRPREREGEDVQLNGVEEEGPS